MKAKTAWTITEVISMAAFLVSSAATVLSDGILRSLYGVSAVLFLICTVLIVLSRRRYLDILDRNSVVGCLRLKRPGVQTSYGDSDRIIPKGNMPKGKMPEESQNLREYEERISDNGDFEGRIPPY